MCVGGGAGDLYRPLDSSSGWGGGELMGISHQGFLGSGKPAKSGNIKHSQESRAILKIVRKVRES